MESGKLIYTIKQDAVSKGLCRLWQRKLQEGLSYQELAEMYIRGIDFCINEDFPTLGFIREHFKGKCEEFGVFVDDEVINRNNARNTVLNGECKAALEYDGYSVSRVFIRHNSKAAINVSQHAYVTIDAFDNTELVVAVSGNRAAVLVNQYGNSNVECIGVGIKVNVMNKNTY